jgi:hypothetical protein
LKIFLLCCSGLILVSLKSYKERDYLNFTYLEFCLFRISIKCARGLWQTAEF